MTDEDHELVRVIDYLRANGATSDAQAIRALLEDIIRDGNATLSAVKKKQRAKTLQNRLIAARKKMAVSRK